MTTLAETLNLCKFSRYESSDPFQDKRRTFLKYAYSGGELSNDTEYFFILPMDVDPLLDHILNNVKPEKWPAAFINEFAPNRPKFQTLDVFKWLFRSNVVVYQKTSIVRPTFPWQIYLDFVYKEIQATIEKRWKCMWIVRHAPKEILNAPENQWIQELSLRLFLSNTKDWKTQKIKEFAQERDGLSFSLSLFLNLKPHRLLDLSFVDIRRYIVFDAKTNTELTIVSDDFYRLFDDSYIATSVLCPFFLPILNQIVSIDLSTDDYLTRCVAERVIKRYILIHETHPEFFTEQSIFRLFQHYLNELTARDEKRYLKPKLRESAFFRFLHFSLTRFESLLIPLCELFYSVSHDNLADFQEVFVNIPASIVFRHLPSCVFYSSCFAGLRRAFHLVQI